MAKQIYILIWLTYKLTLSTVLEYYIDEYKYDGGTCTVHVTKPLHSKMQLQLECDSSRLQILHVQAYSVYFRVCKSSCELVDCSAYAMHGVTYMNDLNVGVQGMPIWWLYLYHMYAFMINIIPSLCMQISMAKQIYILIHDWHTGWHKHSSPHIIHFQFINMMPWYMHCTCTSDTQDAIYSNVRFVTSDVR